MEIAERWGNSCWFVVVRKARCSVVRIFCRRSARTWKWQTPNTFRISSAESRRARTPLYTPSPSRTTTDPTQPKLNSSYLVSAAQNTGWRSKKQATSELSFNVLTQPGQPRSSEYWRWIRPQRGKKRWVLRSGAPCYQDCYHNGLLCGR